VTNDTEKQFLPLLMNANVVFSVDRCKDKRGKCVTMKPREVTIDTRYCATGPLEWIQVHTKISIRKNFLLAVCQSVRTLVLNTLNLNWGQRASLQVLIYTQSLQVTSTRPNDRPVKNIGRVIIIYIFMHQYFGRTYETNATKDSPWFVSAKDVRKR
jgi:hypothetical protein